MIYTVKVKFYAEYSVNEDKMETRYCFVPGASLHDVIDKMEEYYGKDEIEKISIALFSPYDFLEFESSDMFYDVKHTLGAKIMW